MESCNDQYSNNGNKDLYVYTGSGSVCSNLYNGYSDQQPDHTDVYADRPIVQRKYSAITANIINQYHTDNRYVESCNDQYIDSGNNDLYIYTGSGSVCEHLYNGYSDQ